DDLDEAAVELRFETGRTLDRLVGGCLTVEFVDHRSAVDVPPSRRFVEGGGGLVEPVQGGQAQPAERLPQAVVALGMPPLPFVDELIECCGHDARAPSVTVCGSRRPRWPRRVVLSYSVRKLPRSCSSGTTLSTNSSRPPGVRCGTRMNPSLASVCTYRSISSATCCGVPMNCWRAVTSMMSSRMLRFSASAFSFHCRATASGSLAWRTRPRVLV